MLPKKINIFTLSEKEDDAAFINSTLRNAGISAHSIWSKDPEKCLFSLKKNDLHLIFFRTANFSAKDEEWIERFKEIEKNIPIILVHEEISEQTLSACLQMNAHDLVTLDIPDRLLFITMRELSTYLKTLELLKLRKENQTYKSQIQSIQKESDIASLVLSDGIIINSNPVANTLLIGNKEETFDTQTILDFVADSDQLVLKGALQAAKQGKFENEELVLKFHIAGSDDLQRMQCDISEYLFQGETSLKIDLKELATPVSVQHNSFSIDPLSNVYHRKHFLEVAGDALKQKSDNDNGILAMLYIKVDDFKQYQDTYNLLSTDEIVKHMGGALIETSNKGDIYGRFSGNAFVVQSQKGSLRDVESWATHLQNYLSENTVTIENDEIALSCTIGIAEFLNGNDDLVKWVTRAKEANYAAFKNSKGSVHTSQSITETTQTLRLDLEWTPRIKSALMQNRFQLFQFPISSLRQTSKDMIDVYLRMRDEVGDVISPNVFMPVAKRNNLEILLFKLLKKISLTLTLAKYH